MRKVLAVLLASAFAGACATTNSSVTQAPPAVGVYRLLAVDGYAVPHTLTSGDLTGQEIIASELKLNGDKTFELRTTMRAQLSTPAPIKFERHFNGTYEPSEIGVQLTWRGNLSTSAAFVGKALRIYLDGVEHLYIK